MLGISEVEFEDAVVQMYCLSTRSRSSQAQQAGSLCTELFRQLIILVILLFTNVRFVFCVFVALLTGVVAAAFLRMVLEGHGVTRSCDGTERPPSGEIRIRAVQLINYHNPGTPKMEKWSNYHNPGIPNGKMVKLSQS